MKGLILLIDVCPTPEQHMSPRNYIGGLVWAQKPSNVKLAKNGHPSLFKGRYDYLKIIDLGAIIAFKWLNVTVIMLLKTNKNCSSA